MADQVQYLNKEPVRHQIGEPGAPCGGSSTCTDNVGAMIVFHETGKRISTSLFRSKAAPGKDPCRGLNAAEFIRGLAAFGVKGYALHVNPSSSDVLRATDNGIVMVSVGYNGYPTVSECEVGGKTDMGFRGPHAVSVWGRRNWGTAPVGWPRGKTFIKGWRVWGRDPDHRFWETKPPYDRYRSGYLTRAMQAIVGNRGWRVRAAVWKGDI